MKVHGQLSVEVLVDRLSVRSIKFKSIANTVSPQHFDLLLFIFYLLVQQLRSTGQTENYDRHDFLSHIIKFTIKC